MTMRLSKTIKILKIITTTLVFLLVLIVHVKQIHSYKCIKQQLTEKINKIFRLSISIVLQNQYL